MTRKDLTIWKPGSLWSGQDTLGRFVDSINKEFDRICRDMDFSTKAFSDMQPRSRFPKINVSETEENYELEIALAGFNKEDISLELKDNSVFIKAEKQEEKSEEGPDKKYLMKEISSRSFRRVVNLPKKVITDGIKCSHKDGIISCVLKKEPEVKPEEDTIKIDIN
jgi:HSP20 family protein